MQARIDSPDYWIDGFQPNESDMAALYEQTIEVAHPQGVESICAFIIHNRVSREIEARQARAAAKGTVYKPSDRYDVGQKLLFSALGGAEGVVAAVRPGNNPSYGAYQVIQVEIAGQPREFAAGLEVDHSLSQTEIDLDPEALADRYAAVIAAQMVARLVEDPDWLSYGDRWILRALLPEVNLGHRNLAEAIIMIAGEPLPAEQILGDLDFDKQLPAETRTIALEMALSKDERFRNVGALEAPLWTLKSQI